MRATRFVLALLLVASPLAADAALDRWIGLTRSDDGTEFKAASNSITTVMGDRVAVSTLELGGPPQILKSGKVATYGRSKWFADCSRNALGLAELVLYDDSGGIVLRQQISQPSPTAVQPGSVAELIFHFACDAEFRRKQIEWYEDPASKPMPTPAAAAPPREQR